MKTMEICNGGKRAVFVNPDGAGWTPHWFFEGDRPMLRFKDHEWMTFGHLLRPTRATVCDPLPDGGAVFRGRDSFGSTPVDWTVGIVPDPCGPGFILDCVFTPAAGIELLEAFTTLETPYDYDGRETVTTVIGMNPVSQWRGNRRCTPPPWEHPAWIYARPQSARMTAPCQAPYLCQAIVDAGATPDRFVTVVGDWNVCRIRDGFATPTRDTPEDPPSIFRHPAERKGYKYIVGALNWSSACVKDPNVLFAGGAVARQRIIVDFGSTPPGGTLDAMLLRAWERAALLSLPADGRIEAFERATARGVTWTAAGQWLRDTFCSETPTPGLFDPAKGICTYAPGTRPKAGGDYGLFWWVQWSGPLHYRARMTDDAHLERVCLRFDEQYRERVAAMDPFGDEGIASKICALPSIWWACVNDPAGALAEAFRSILGATLEMSVRENGRARRFDYGAQAAIAEALLLGSTAFGNAAMRDQALLLLTEIEERLDRQFWQFNVGRSDSLAHGGQIRSLGHGHAVLANLLAARITGRRRYLDNARRFARFLLSINYATHSDSEDPDFDWRGWCNGSNAGRDQIAEFPPWETQNGLLCISALMEECELENGFYDALWYIARTGLAQFPAARTVKRIRDERMAVRYVPRAEIASERDLYDVLPYLAYENPHDQTMLASYQGADCLVGAFVYGGALVQAVDRRLGTVSPRAALLDLRERAERRVHVWNPTAESIESELVVRRADGSEKRAPVLVPPRTVVRMTLEA